MKAATAYLKDDRVFLHSSSKTTAGMWILSEPIFSVEKMDSELLGRYTLDALHASTQQVSQPQSWDSLFTPVLKLAGVKSLSAFMKSAKCVEIEFDGEQVRLIPTQNLGVDDGFQPLQSKEILSEIVPDKLGTAVVAALLQSK